MKGASWPEKTVAISAVVIGLAALFVSTYATYSGYRVDGINDEVLPAGEGEELF